MKSRPLREVQELLGHKSIRMTERYSHLAPERLREAVATLEGFFSTSSAQTAPAPLADDVSMRYDWQARDARTRMKNKIPATR